MRLALTIILALLAGCASPEEHVSTAAKSPKQEDPPSAPTDVPTRPATAGSDPPPLPQEDVFEQWGNATYAGLTVEGDRSPLDFDQRDAPTHAVVVLWWNGTTPDAGVSVKPPGGCVGALVGEVCIEDDTAAKHGASPVVIDISHAACGSDCSWKARLDSDVGSGVSWHLVALLRYG